ncbi:MAG: lipid-A-disaccharide synthase [Burkholderiaceae bacterium]
MDGSGLTLGAVAGEKSGDMLAAGVLAALAEAGGGLDARGIGGPSMAAAGFERWWDIEALSVNGYAEVLREYPRLRRMREDLKRRLVDWRPEIFLGVDAPDFNLDVEKRMRAAGVPVVHFIGPSIWAWRGGRIDRIRDSVDHMLLVFPFEQEIYEKAGIASTYVGHPLADAIPPEPPVAAARLGLGLAPDVPVVALLPGSRTSEVRMMAAEFMRTAAWLHARRPGLQFVLPAASTALFETLRGTLADLALPEDLDLRIISGRARDALAAADTVLVASGTATLEAALFHKPMVIAYRLAWLSYRIMRRMGYLPWVGLPNILCRDWVVPEFIQDAARAERMGPALLAQLDDEPGRQAIGRRFAELGEQLRRGCAGRAAEAILDMRRGPGR